MCKEDKMDFPKFMQLKEAIQYSGLSRSTLHKLDRQGKLVPMRTKNNRRVYTSKMIDDFMNNKK